MDKQKLMILNAGRRFGKTSMVYYCTVRNAVEARTDLTDEEKEKLIQALMSRYNAAIGDFE